MYYYFYSTDLIRFIFSYTHCIAMKYKTFRTFWQNFVKSLPQDFNTLLDFGKYYYCNHDGPYLTPYEELEDIYPEFIDFSGFNSIHLICHPQNCTGSCKTYDPEYATKFLGNLKKADPTAYPTLTLSLLKAIGSIKDDLTYPKKNCPHNSIKT